MVDSVAALLPRTIGALLLLPPLALLLFRILRAAPRRLLRATLLGCAGLFSTVLLAAWKGFGLPSRAAGCYAVLAAYGAFCFLVTAAPLVRPRALRWAASLAGGLVIGLGYVDATAGMLGLGWDVEEAIRPSDFAEGIAPGLVCEQRSWGGAWSASGYALHLYETWPLGLRREVASFSVQETAPADQGLSCAETYARYRAGSGR